LDEQDPPVDLGPDESEEDDNETYVGQFREFFETRTIVPEYIGIPISQANRRAKELGVEDVRVVVVDGWFGYTSEVDNARLNFITRHDRVLRAWLG
jgi:hypothetical protein